MTTAQQIFSIFFAVLYGAMLTSISGLQAFPWGFPAERGKRIRLAWRLLVALLCFNILPFLIFASGYMVLASHETSALTYLSVLGIAVSSLSVFAPYRIYHWLMVALRDGAFSLYDTADYEIVRNSRSIRESPLGQFLALIIYGLAFFLTFWVNC